MAEENPQVEEPTEPKPEEIQNEISEVMAELQKIGIETPQDVQNLHTAASQTGKAWNEVGELRKEVQELKTRHQPKQDDYDYDTPVDLRGEIRGELKSFWREMKEAETEQYNNMARERAAIHSDPDYGLVGDAFEKHMANSQTQLAMASGNTSATSEYNKFVRGYYRKIAQRSRDALEKVQNMTVPKSAPPHVEKGSSSQPRIQEDDEKVEKLKQAKKSWTGTDDDIDRMLEAIIEPGGLAGMK